MPATNTQDLSMLSWDEIQRNYPDIYSEYVQSYGEPSRTPGTPGNPAVASPGSAAPGAVVGGYPTTPQLPNLLQNLSDVSNAQGVPYGDVATNVNRFMQEQAVAPYLANMPNYAALTGQLGSNTMDYLQGKVPQDVWNQLAQRAAERGTAMGSPGSPNANAALLAALGTNSLALQQRGAEQYRGMVADTPVAPLWNPMSLYVPVTLAQMEQDEAERAREEAETQARIQERRDELSGGGGYTITPSAPRPPGQAGPFPNPTYTTGTPGGSNPINPPAVGGTGQLGTWIGGQFFTDEQLAARNAGGSPAYGVPTGPGTINVTPPSPMAEEAGWSWDPLFGAYVNQYTGQISDTGDASGLWGGFSVGGANTPAQGSLGSDVSPTGAALWEYVPDVQAFVNTATGELSSTPGPEGSWGMTIDQAMTPAADYATQPNEQWQWDDLMGGYVNVNTGMLSDTPSEQGSWGVTYDQMNAPAEPQNPYGYDWFYEDPSGGYSYSDAGETWYGDDSGWEWS